MARLTWAVAFLLLLAIAAVCAILARNYIRDHPQDVPWTELRLSDPVGRFTQRKLAALHEDPGLCRTLLVTAGAEMRAVPPRQESPQCGYDDGMRLAGDLPRFAPAGPITSCPVAAGMFLFQRQVLQPAAIKHFGQPVEAVHHVGSYSCRRLYNRAGGRFSEHATANAFDITGFTIKGGERVSVLRDWNSPGRKAAFLRDVRSGACSLFATVLSPDYNTAHADHLHLDQADRGRSGWRMCR